MDISNYIKEELIEIKQGKGITKDDVLNTISELVIKQIGLNKYSQKKVKNKLKEREELGTTGFGNGIAIPHCALEGIDDFIIGIITYPQGADFESMDKKPVQVVAFIIAPEKKRNQHIRFLSAISGILRLQEAVKEMVLEKTTIAVRESFLRYSLPASDDKKQKDEYNLLHIFCQVEEKFDEIISLLTEVSECDLSILDGRDAGQYINAVPLFSKFWTESEKGFHRLIMAVLPNAVTNDVIRKIDHIIATLSERTGVMVMMQKVEYLSGYLNL